MKFNAINLAEVARRMGKKRHWLYQRLNQNIVNKKPAYFKQHEKELFINTVIEVIEEVGEELSNFKENEPI